MPCEIQCWWYVKCNFVWYVIMLYYITCDFKSSVRLHVRQKKKKYSIIYDMPNAVSLDISYAIFDDVMSYICHKTCDVVMTIYTIWQVIWHDKLYEMLYDMQYEILYNMSYLSV